MKGRDLIENRNHESTLEFDSVTKGLSNNSWNCRSFEDDSAKHGNKKGKRSLRKSILSKCFSGKSQESESKHWYANKIMWNINQSPDCARISWEYIDVFLIYFVAASKCVALPFLDFDERESEHSGRKNVADDKVFTILRKHFWSPSRKLFGGTGGGGEDREKWDEMKI